MSCVERRIDVPHDAVASLLADPRAYDGVVVGSKRVRWFDARWPEGGTSFHHSIGLGPVHIRDRTTVIADELPHRLHLLTGMGPLGSAEVEFVLIPDGDGTLVRMCEEAAGGLFRALWSPPLDAAMRARNREALRRLEELAGARARVRALDG